MDRKVAHLLKFSHNLTFIKNFTFLIETNNSVLLRMLNFSDPLLLSEEIMEKHKFSISPWVKTVGEIIKSALVNEYEIYKNRDSLFSGSAVLDSIRRYCIEGEILLFFSDEDISKVLKTRNWKKVLIDNEIFIVTQTKQYSIFLFTERISLLIRVKKLKNQKKHMNVSLVC